MKKSILAFFVIFVLLCSTTFSFAAADPAVTIVNPINKSTTTSSNVLISVKVTQPKSIRITLVELKYISNGEYVSLDLNKITSGGGDAPKLENMKSFPTSMQATNFKTYNNLTFCTKQVNGLKIGAYKVKVDTLDGAGRAIYSRESNFIIKSKEEPDAKTFENQQSGTFQFLQNILKSIFGS